MSAGTARAIPTAHAAPRSPRGSRIVAVCDAYEAMTADRTYRRALTPATPPGTPRTRRHPVRPRGRRPVPGSGCRAAACRAERLGGTHPRLRHRRASAHAAGHRHPLTRRGGRRSRRRHVRRLGLRLLEDRRAERDGRTRTARGPGPGRGPAAARGRARGDRGGRSGPGGGRDGRAVRGRGRHDRRPVERGDRRQGGAAVRRGALAPARRLDPGRLPEPAGRPGRAGADRRHRRDRAGDGARSRASAAPSRWTRCPRRRRSRATGRC